MKVTYRIPTKDQYAFVEITEEHDGATPFEHRVRYDELREAFLGEKKPTGLDTKTFNACLDEFCKTNKLSNGTELYYAMSPEQQMVFQELKKCFKRIGSIS